MGASKILQVVLVAQLSVFTAVLCVLCAGCGACEEELPPPRPTVAVAEPIRRGVSLESQGQTTAIEGLERVEEGACVTTAAGGRASIRIDNGAWLLLDQATEVRPELAGLNLTRGRVWVDTSTAEETTVETAKGTITASGAAFSVTLTESAAEIYCGSGELTYRSGSVGGRLQQGESITLASSGDPQPRPESLWDDWTGGLADPAARLTSEPAAVGELAGRRLDARGQARLPVPVRAHDVNVTIRGDLAVTEVVQTFFNARSDVLEAEYTIRLPREAIVTGFAISHGRQDYVDSTVGPLAMVGEEPAWRSGPVAPSALTHDGPERLRARLYPLAPGATVRVRLTYAQWLERRENGMRTYVYPMGVEGTPPLLGELTLTADLSDAGATSVRAGMGAQVEARRVVLRRSDFRPRADFYLDLIERRDGAGGATAQAYVVDVGASERSEGGEASEEAYVLFDIPTAVIDGSGSDGGSASEEQVPLELVLLVDVSGGTDLEHLELARAIVEAALRQLAPTDRVALLLADVTGHAPEDFHAPSPPPAGEGLREASEATRESILEALARASLGGATDLARSLSDAAVLVAGRPRGAVLYIGDGEPSTGMLDATAIRSSLAAIESPPRFFALGVGEGSNIGLLRSLFGDGADPVLERTEASRLVMQLLAEASQPTLRGVHAELGPTVERIYPSTFITLPAGRNLRLVGRLNGDVPESITVRGQRDGQPFEQVLPVVARREDDGGYVRRRWAAQRFAELLDQGARHDLLLNLAARFDIVTPWTALVVGGARGVPYGPLRGFDRNPAEVAWQLGGGTAAPSSHSGRSQPVLALESTWTPRVSDEAASISAPIGGDGGIARAAVARAIVEGERAPRACYERRLLARPELSGEVTVRVAVDGLGAVREVSVTASTLRDRRVERCLLSEVRGISFPNTGATVEVTTTHRFVFAMPTSELGARRQCSRASRKPLRQRRALWAERLALRSGLDGALGVYREADQKCELGSWMARRTLLAMMLRHAGNLAQRIRLYQFFGAGTSVAAFLKREILRTVHTPEQMVAVRVGLGLEVAVEWSVFSGAWNEDPSNEARLLLVRRWLEAVPFDVDLRLRLLRLLEQTGSVAEARRRARELAADPLCDASARAELAEFWIRQDEIVEARRALTGIVEHTPLDPWAHRRVGDLCLAFGWGEGAYREYETLARLRPADPDVTLLLARAAAASGRIDEALRLEQRLSETVSPSADRGAAAFARLWTAVHLARLQEGAETAEVRAAIARRQRASGVLRDRPLLFATLTWDHPDRRPELFVRYPSATADDLWSRVPLRGGHFGIEALRVRDHDPGTYHFEVRRPAGTQREIEARLLVVSMPGTSDQHIAEVPISLSSGDQSVRFRLTDTGELESTPVLVSAASIPYPSR